MIALTYDLESSLNGTEHLRKSPVNTIKVNQGFGDDKITNLAGKSHSFKFESIKSGFLSVKHHETNNRNKLQILFQDSTFLNLKQTLLPLELLP